MYLCTLPPYFSSQVNSKVNPVNSVSHSLALNDSIFKQPAVFSLFWKSHYLKKYVLKF